MIPFCEIFNFILCIQKLFGTKLPFSETFWLQLCVFFNVVKNAKTEVTTFLHKHPNTFRTGDLRRMSIRFGRIVSWPIRNFQAF
jgi:hypothetical protein